MPVKEVILDLRLILLKNSKWLLLLVIFSFFIFLRFYDLENRTPFSFDQVTNAWAMKDFILDHKLLLVGPVAKGNSGFYVGPFYYYYLSIFYFITKLDPIAAGWAAGVASIFTFVTLFYVANKVFSFRTALIAVLIHTVSYYAIGFDRIQWPVNFIFPLSLIIFYSLYKVITGKEKYLLLLAVAFGFSFSMHFTAVFFPIMILFSLPFFPKTIQTLKYSIVAVLLFVIFLIPNIIYELNSKASSSKHLSGYINTYYHGFHFVRFIQMVTDAFIEAEATIFFKILKPVKYLIYPLFVIIFYLKKPTKNTFTICYLFGLWFLIPWIVFTVYKGEITNYYFSLTRPIVILILAYLFSRMFEIKNVAAKIIVIIFIVYYSFFNVSGYMNEKMQGLSGRRNNVIKAIESKKKIPFQEGVPESYIYYIYTIK